MQESLAGAEGSLLEVPGVPQSPRGSSNRVSACGLLSSVRGETDHGQRVVWINPSDLSLVSDVRRRDGCVRSIARPSKGGVPKNPCGVRSIGRPSSLYIRDKTYLTLSLYLIRELRYTGYTQGSCM